MDKEIYLDTKFKNIYIKEKGRGWIWVGEEFGRIWEDMGEENHNQIILYKKLFSVRHIPLIILNTDYSILILGFLVACSQFGFIVVVLNCDSKFLLSKFPSFLG